MTVKFVGWKNGLNIKWDRENGSNMHTGSVNYKFKAFGGRGFIDFRNTNKYVLAFIHIQKVGGTNLEKRLKNDIEGMECNCKVRTSCSCLRSNGKSWVVMRYTQFGNSKTVWPCGLHPDYTMLVQCIPKLMHDVNRKHVNATILYFTLLRNPVERYLSEFRHVQRGGTWRKANIKCKSSNLCYDGDNWSNATLKSFMACEWNPANNRQTRMLADLTSVGCDNFDAMKKEKRDEFLYKSAVRLLRSIPFFALTEMPAKSQFIFEKTFNLKFKKDWGLYETGYSKEFMKNVSRDDIKQIEQVNHLDMKLYTIATQLFKKRLSFLEKVFSEVPKNTKVIKNKKDKSTLQKNWKNKKTKMKVKEKKIKKKRGKKDKKRKFKKLKVTET